MPQITVRKRVGRRSGGWRYRLSRWSYRYRPQIAVAVAFGVMVLVAVAVMTAMQAASGGGPEEAPAVAAPPA